MNLSIKSWLKRKWWGFTAGFVAGGRDPFGTIALPERQPQPSVMRHKRVLLVPLEFRTWSYGRYWSYPAGLGLEEGLDANDIEYLTIPATFGVPSSASTSWLHHAREFCAGKNFEQAWLTVNHSNLDETFLSWLTEVAPVRLGIVVESLEITPEEWKSHPKLCEARQAKVERCLKYLTHAAVVDEKDISSLVARGIPTMWWPPTVPKRCIQEWTASGSNNSAVFFGAVYGERKSWLEHPGIKGLLVRPSASPEDDTVFPDLFDKLNVVAEVFLAGKPGVDERMLSSYLERLRHIRRNCFALWLEGLRSGCAVVNLPQYGRFYSGRVFEGMAAGRPVVSYEIPERPMTKALFEDGKEILLFPKDDPWRLAEHIRRIRSDPAYGRQIAENARRKLERCHTTEKRVEQLLGWVENGRQPTYQ